MSVPLIVFMLLHAPVFIPGAVPAGIYGNCIKFFANILLFLLISMLCLLTVLLIQWYALQQKFIMEPLCLMLTGCTVAPNHCLLSPIYSLFWDWEEHWGSWKKRIQRKAFLKLLKTVKKEVLSRQFFQYPDGRWSTRTYPVLLGFACYGITKLGSTQTIHLKSIHRVWKYLSLSKVWG